MNLATSSLRTRRIALRQSGFTLVELMISMVIGLFIVLALLTLLINVNRNNSEMTKSNRVIENGRFSLQMLEADVSHVGFWGGFLPQFDDLTIKTLPLDVPTALPDPCLSYGAWDAQYRTNLIGIPLQAYEIPAIVPSPTVPVCASRVANPQPSTDVLVVRHLEPCVAGLDGCPAANTTDVYFQMPRCMDNTSPNYSTSTYAFGTSATLAVTPLYKRKCTTVASADPNDGPADAFKFVSNLYYVRNYAVTPGDGVPTLMRSEFTSAAHQAPAALIEGVEGFRVELGLDTVSDSGAAVSLTAAITWADPTNLKSPTNRGDGIPDSVPLIRPTGYVHCTVAAPCTVADLANAVAAKIYVLVRAENQTAGYTDTKSYCLASACPTAADKMGPFNDHYKRHLFVQTVRLTNVSARRETPP